MIIALLSDLHDRFDLWDKANAELKKLGIKRLLFLGDTCAPVMVRHMAQTFDGTIDHIFGNVDGDRFNAARMAADYKNITLHGQEAELKIDDKKIFMVHYPIYAEHAAASGKYDFVFFGHSHERLETTVGKTKLVNPGTMSGILHPPTFAICDLVSGKVVFHDLS